ncbi:MAG TPA: methyl-accepting chemotaxis protein, partial [Mycobacteriales bacterium]|nr:methyl-accepting chemotaxis protein [Mycobacteriales bacterium]
MYDRLRLEATIVSFGKLVATAIAVTALHHWTTGPTHDHAAVIYLWLAIGLVGVAAVPALAWSRTRAPGLENLLVALIGAVDFAVVTAVLGLTGGVTGPFWVLVIVNTAAAAVIGPNKIAAYGVCIAYVGVVVGGTAIAHELNNASIGPIVLIGMCIPLITMLGSAVATRLERQRADSDAEREQLRTTVRDLSSALAMAAQGDLSVKVESAEVDEEILSGLASSFDYTLGNIRALVGQIRVGGDQIVSSAHELLASAEQHAASATEQSSAVSETTSTIEELAATAAQIADTSESVARYAAETLRHAEEGREAVAASVMAMDAIATSVEQIGGRALSLGEKGQEIGRILDVINDLADQTNLLALNAAIEAARAGENGRGF